MSRFNNAVMLGNVEERVKIMSQVGQARGSSVSSVCTISHPAQLLCKVPLAALTAKAHNLEEFLPKFEENMQDSAHLQFCVAHHCAIDNCEDVFTHVPPNATLMLPPVP
eukprot:3849810-Amphidinium_carterae.1